MCDTLPAERTGDFVDLFISVYIDRCSWTCTCNIPNVQSLDLVTNLDTAHTFDTFAWITDEWECLVPRSFFKTFFERKIDQVQVICNLLKCTVPASDTGCTFAVMLGKDKLYSLSSCNAYFWAVGVDHHAFGYDVITWGDQTIFPFNLNNTDTAGRNLVDIF